MTDCSIEKQFVWTQLHQKELLRLERFLKNGTEMNIAFSNRYSTFNSFVSNELDNELTSNRDHNSTRLNCVKNLWQFSKNYSINDQKNVCERIECCIRRIFDERKRFYRNAISFVILVLVSCQKPNHSKRSPFRALAAKLLCDQTICSPIDVIIICHSIGRQGLNSSKQMRALLSNYYLSERNDRQLAQMFVCSSKFGWSHCDIIKLCHIKPNELIEMLINKKPNTDKMPQIVKNILILRSNSVKLSDVLEAITESKECLNQLWFRALNSVWFKQPKVWSLIIRYESRDTVLRNIPRILSKFPNNKMLFDEIVAKMSSKSECNSKSKFVRELVGFWCESIYTRHKSELMRSVCQSLRSIATQHRSNCLPIYVIIDSTIVANQKFVDSTKIKRRKQNFIDNINLANLLEFLLKSLPQCFIRHTNDALVEITTENMNQVILNVHNGLQNVWKCIPENFSNVLHVTNDAQDINLWMFDDKKLIILHLNKINLKSVSHFRQNVLVLNGIDCDLDVTITDHFISSNHITTKINT